MRTKLCACLVAIGGSPVTAEEIFKPGSGLTQYYLEYRGTKPIFEGTNDCPPGVAEIGGTTNPCGGAAPPVTPPINPCDSGMCGPGVGLEGGLSKTPPDGWNAIDAIVRKLQ